MPGTVKTFSQPEQQHITKWCIGKKSRSITQQVCRRKKTKIQSFYIQMRRWPRPPPFVIFKAIESAPFQSPSHLKALFSDTNWGLLSRQSPRQLSINRWTEIDNVPNPSRESRESRNWKSERITGWWGDKGVGEDIIYQNQSSDVNPKCSDVL